MEGATFTKLKDFNPSSRDHIAWILQNYDKFEADIDYLIWENDGGRDDFEEPWYWFSSGVPPGSGVNEDTGDDVRRRERMAEAMYEI